MMGLPRISFHRRFGSSPSRLGIVRCARCGREQVKAGTLYGGGYFFCSGECRTAHGPVSRPKARVSSPGRRGSWTGILLSAGTAAFIVLCTAGYILYSYNVHEPDAGVPRPSDIGLAHMATENEPALSSRTIDDRETAAEREQQREPESLDRGPLDRPCVALTFDAGRFTGGAEEILGILSRNGLRVTMFLTGEFMERNPGLTGRIAAEGHEVANHTQSHPHFLNRNPQSSRYLEPTAVNIERELAGCRKTYRRLTGRDMAPYWRAPYGERNPRLLRYARSIGWHHVGWTSGRTWRSTMDTLDWESDEGAGSYFSSEQVRDKILNFGSRSPHRANGAIILMHLGTGRMKDPVHARLDEIIRGLRERGYRLVTVGEMFRNKRVK